MWFWLRCVLERAQNPGARLLCHLSPPLPLHITERQTSCFHRDKHAGLPSGLLGPYHTFSPRLKTRSPEPCLPGNFSLFSRQFSVVHPEFNSPAYCPPQFAVRGLPIQFHREDGRSRALHAWRHGHGATGGGRGAGETFGVDLDAPKLSICLPGGVGAFLHAQARCGMHSFAGLSMPVQCQRGTPTDACLKRRLWKGSVLAFSSTTLRSCYSPPLLAGTSSTAP